MSTPTFMLRATARRLAEGAVSRLDIPGIQAFAGTYQSPTRSRLIAEIATALGGTGLLRCSHLLAFMEAAESVRVNVYTSGAGAYFEDPELNLRRRAAALLPDPEAFPRPDTVRKVLALFDIATFKPPI